jgi:hypothetical protein
MHFMNEGMSLSGIIRSNWREDGYLGIYHKVQLYQLTRKMQELKEEYSKGWLMETCIDEWWWLRGIPANQDPQLCKG